MMCATLRSKRLLLRRPEFSDAGRVRELMNNWNVVSMLARPPYPYTRADADSYMAGAAGRAFTADEAVYAITGGGAFMGMIGITPLNERPSLGYWLGEPYWRQGLMAEAVRIVVAEFFRKSGCVYLMSGVFVDNAASLALQRKIGFEVVGEEAMECIARGSEVPSIVTRLAREKFEETVV